MAGLDCFQRCLEALASFKSKDIKCTHDVGMAVEDKKRRNADGWALSKPTIFTKALWQYELSLQPFTGQGPYDGTIQVSSLTAIHLLEMDPEESPLLL